MKQQQDGSTEAKGTGQTAQTALQSNTGVTSVYQAKRLLTPSYGNSTPSVYIRMTSTCCGHISSACWPPSNSQ